ncbi:hypothetical protein DCAR_0104348 [Daucus carota subsp. sativus]|uniref:Uncharacterized protein n=1 Tax=Daucus carota subsp. sativus TaxID=79200 RepID=A0A166IRT8_DAUCS|nr:hypothetical protein DCAR_0104348 [Daucus carota subsp. sativus]
MHLYFRRDGFQIYKSGSRSFGKGRLRYIKYDPRSLALGLGILQSSGRQEIP